MAFPSTSLLDNFNRANENPLANGHWAQAGPSDPSGCQLVSNQATGHSGGVGSSSYWTTSFGPAVEAWITLSTKWSTNFSGLLLYASMATPNTPGFDGYLVVVYGNSGVDTCDIYRIDNDAGTLLGPSTTGITIAAGNKFGVRVSAGVVSVYQYTGGAWNQTPIATRSDAAYPSGFIGLGIDDNVITADDFGGGTFGLAFLAAWANQ